LITQQQQGVLDVDVLARWSNRETQRRHAVPFADGTHPQPTEPVRET
jgi:hypothetical protein